MDFSLHKNEVEREGMNVFCRLNIQLTNTQRGNWDIKFSQRPPMYCTPRHFPAYVDYVDSSSFLRIKAKK